MLKSAGGATIQAGDTLPAGLIIPGPSITGVATGVPTILGQWGIPFIGLSSGSVAANGAISGITALPVAYPRAYCWFPANILATVSTAGWYYCTFSTTTAGVAFLDTYTTGVPTIPSSPTAVSDGKGAFTGATGEIFGPTITLPANYLGTAGQVRIRSTWASTSNANSKTGIIRHSGNAGTVMKQFTLSSVVVYMDELVIMASGATNTQTAMTNAVNNTPFAAVNAAPIINTVDTTASSTIVFTTNRGTATDNLIVGGASLEVYKGV